MNDETSAEEQFIDFKCPCCGEQVSFPAGLAGSAQECVGCGEPVIVPKSGGDGGKIPLPVATEHLSLRRFRGADWKNLLQLFADDDFCDSAPFILPSEDRIARWLEEDAVVKITTPDVPFTLAVESLESSKIIGILTLTFSDAERLQAVLTVALLPDFVQRGLDTEAALGALGFCFDGISLHRVQGFCVSTNAAVCQMFEKAGMRREGEFVQNRKIRGQWANTVAYAILRGEFRK